jgi:hypothetical protein
MFGLKDAVKNYFAEFKAGKSKYITLYAIYGAVVFALIILDIGLGVFFGSTIIWGFIERLIGLSLFYLFIRALMREDKNFINAVKDFTFDDFIKIGQIYAITLLPYSIIQDIIFPDASFSNLGLRIVLDCVVTAAVYIFLESLIYFAAKRRWLLFGDTIAGAFNLIKKTIIPLSILKIFAFIITIAMPLIMLLLGSIISVFALFSIILTIPFGAIVLFAYFSIAVLHRGLED